MSCLLYQKDKIVGVFDELQKAKDMAQGILDNGWAEDFHIVKYKLNTCLKICTYEIKNNNETDTESSSSDNNKYIELKTDEEKSKEKSLIQKKLNLLKLQKEKLEESKTKYEIDLDLYKQFKLKLEEDINFEIPELFQEKYKIFHQLESQDNLNWETFSLLYKEPDFHGNYSNVFELANDFETKFLTNIDTETEDDSDYDSDDETSNSDNVIEIVEVLNSSDENSSSD